MANHSRPRVTGITNLFFEIWITLRLAEGYRVIEREINVKSARVPPVDGWTVQPSPRSLLRTLRERCKVRRA
jgi:hypothetical protein